MSTSEFYTLRLGVYNQLIEYLEHIERKGKTMPYTSINGHMFSFLSKEGEMGLRLSKADLDDFINEYKAELMVQHGKTMKEYVKIPSNLFNQIDILSSYLHKSLDYVSGLKPKPKKKK